jgi:hypothetical protein
MCEIRHLANAGKYSPANKGVRLDTTTLQSAKLIATLVKELQRVRREACRGGIGDRFNAGNCCG